MERLEHIMMLIDDILDTKRKRHILGGILFSAALFFGGLAITVMTINREETVNA